MGRHAASGSDGLVGDDGPDRGGRRRTDAADALWGGMGPATGEDCPPYLSGSAARQPSRPVLAPEARAVRVPSAASSRARMADAMPSARPRPPMPPVPPPAAPRTSAAPFAAVPSPAPEHEALRPSATALDERPHGPSVLSRIPAPAGPPMLSQPVPELPPRPASSWVDGEHQAPWQTGRGEIRADRGAPSLPFVERRSSRLSAGSLSSAGQAEMPTYGDWTKPSGPGRVPSAPVPPLPLVPPAPLTSAIPDRDVIGRRSEDLDDRRDARYDGARYDDARHDDRYEDDARFDDRYQDDRYEDDRYDDRYDDERDAHDLRGPATPLPGHVTGTVVGGRAALRAEREAREASRVAAEAARRKEAGIEDLDEPRRPRRVLKGLAAVGVVAAAVLGVYTVTTPDTQEAASQQPSAATTPAPTAGTDAPGVTEALPTLDIDPPVAESSAPAAPVRLPVTVLNATEIQGLAADVSAVVEKGGWETEEPAGYQGQAIAASTVFYTKGDDEQRAAALQLVEQFPELQGPTPRFFEVPADISAPGLVVVLTGDWKP